MPDPVPVMLRFRILRFRPPDPSTTVTSSPEPPLALFGDTAVNADETMVPNNAKGWHHAIRPGSAIEASSGPETVTAKKNPAASRGVGFSGLSVTPAMGLTAESSPYRRPFLRLLSRRAASSRWTQSATGEATKIDE